MNRLREVSRARGWRFEMLLETHDAFCSSRDCQKLNELVDEPLGFIWDSHHTWKFAGETAEESWLNFGPQVRHVHYKDGRTRDGSYKYVLPGEGEYPTSVLFELLEQKGYEGGVSLEWEKLWVPELAPLRKALEKFVRVSAERK